MIVKNEEKLLGRCLDSVCPAVDEIVIVDTGSRDRTLKIARRYGAKIYPFRMGDNFLRARNEYLRRASCDWILTLDADEVIARKDLNGLRKLLSNPKVSGYVLPVRNYLQASNLLRRWHPSTGEYPREEIGPGWFHSESLRLFRNQRNFAYQGCLLQPDIRDSILEAGGRIEKCSVTIHHHSYLKYHNFSDIKRKQLRYLRIGLKSLKAYPRNSALLFHLGNILFLYRRDARQAIPYVQKAIRINPKYVRSYWLLSFIYQRQKKYCEAQKVLNKALRADPKEKDLTFYFLGDLYLRMLDLSKASTFLKKSVILNPGNPTAHNALGVVYEMRGDNRGALSEYRESFRLNKKNTYADENIRRIYNALRRHKSD